MSGKKSKDKGKRFERQVARDLREIYPEARRGIQSRNAEDKVPDVMDVGPFRVECKHHKKAPLRSALQQAIDVSDVEQIPVAICKDDRQDPIVLLRYDDFIKIIKMIEKQNDKQQIKQDKDDREEV